MTTTFTLDQLVDQLATDVPTTDDPQWVSIHRPAAGGSKPRIRVYPEELVCWKPPASCIAVGLVGSAQARRVGPADGELWASTMDGDPHPEVSPGPLQIAVVVDREGQVAAKASFKDGIVLREAPSTGVMLDVLKRCFQLPTAPPEWPSDTFLTLIWLAAVLGATPHGRRLNWRDVVGYHPVAVVLAQHDEEIPPDRITEILRIGGRAWTWSRLRELAIESESLTNMIPSEVAAWLDEGSFARWVLNRQPTTEAMVEAVSGLLTNSARHKLKAYLSDTGVLLAA